MMYWLAQAARELREAAGRKQVHVAASASMDQSTVNRFERGETQPAHVDTMIAAYADDLEIQPIDVWQRAIDSWRAHEAGVHPAPEGELGRRAEGSATTAKGPRRASNRRQAGGPRDTGRS
jgi:transcriptional regulator with XRE-family HTH domain